jgi:uncharacterized protein
MSQTAAQALAPDLAGRVVGFVRWLRTHGAPLGTGESVDAVAALGHIDVGDAEEFRWALRALLCCRDADWRQFDTLFDAYWYERNLKRAAHAPAAAHGGAAAGRRTVQNLSRRDEQEADSDKARGEGAGQIGGATASEKLESTDLRFIADPAEQARIGDLIERLALSLKARLSRRQRAARRGRRLDMRATIHRSLSYGGVPFRLAFRRRREKPARLVAILDASGSMSLYSAFFTRFMRGVVAAWPDSDAFLFHTRLAHVGPILREPNLSKALGRLAVVGQGWGGGTKIGECLRTFNRNYARTAIDSRTIVIILSDGYDTGQPDVLAREVARLKRRAARLIWLNPMMGWEGYEPLARGMAAVIPYLDLLAPAHDLASLRAVEDYLAQQWRRMTVANR